MENPVNEAIVQGMLEVLVLHIVVKIIIQAGVIDSVYIDVSVGSRKRFPEEGIILLSINVMGGVEVSQLIVGLGNG